MLQSETYSILDCINKFWYDVTSSTNVSSLAQGNGNTVSVDGDWVKCQRTSNNSYVELNSTYNHFDLNGYLGKTITWEIDAETSDTWTMYIIGHNGTMYVTLGLYNITASGNKIENVEIPSNFTQLRFRLATSTSNAIIKTKNWRIYPI